MPLNRLVHVCKLLGEVLVKHILTLLTLTPSTWCRVNLIFETVEKASSFILAALWVLFVGGKLLSLGLAGVHGIRGLVGGFVEEIHGVPSVWQRRESLIEFLIVGNTRKPNQLEGISRN